MNRTELIGEVSKATGLTAKQAESGLKAFENVVTSALRGNDTVRITGFGTFKARERAARRGRNPQTGAPVRIKASKGVGFAAGAGLEEGLELAHPVGASGLGRSLSKRCQGGDGSQGRSRQEGACEEGTGQEGRSRQEGTG